MNGFIQQILIIAFIALFGIVLATPAILVEQASSYDVYFEYDGVISVTEKECLINSYNSVGDIFIKGSKVAYIEMFVDEEKVTTQEAIDGIVFFKYNFGFGQHRVKVIAYDEQGKELKYSRFNLNLEKEDC